MSDYALSLQKALFDALTAAGIAGGRVFDRVESGAAMPYVAFGPSDETEADAEGIAAVTVTQQLDVWSGQPGFVEARQIAGAIRRALHRVALPIAGAHLVAIELRTVRYLRDPDGLTSHAAMDLRAIVESD